MQFQDESGEVQEGRYLTQIRPDGDTAVLTGGNAHKASDHVIRGDLELIKIADGTHKRLSKVPFKITSNTTGESHVIVTDENGYASTSGRVESAYVKYELRREHGGGSLVWNRYRGEL